MAVEDVREILFDFAPQFATEDEGTIARIDRFIEYAAEEMDADAYAAAEEANGKAAGAYFNRANALLAAHMLTLRDQGGGSVSGPVQSKRVGDVSVTYAVAKAASQDGLDQTKYGQQYVEFRRVVYPGAEAVSDAEDA